MSPERAWTYSKWSGAVFLAALLAAAVIPRFAGTRDLKIDRAFYELAAMKEALALYQQRHGGLLPETLAELDQQGFIDRIRPDPWGNAYVYRHSSGAPGYVLYSSGINGIDEGGAGDDVTDPSKHYECKKYGLDCPADIAVDAAAWSAVSAAVAGLAGFLAFGGISLHGRFRRPKKTGFPPPRE